jgi:hypothetical protein
MFSLSLTRTSSVFKKFVLPALELLDGNTYFRKCLTLPDAFWIQIGLLRVISNEVSGRAFLQNLLMVGNGLLKISHFFETLSSMRRLKLCSEVSIKLEQKVNHQRTHKDIFKDLPELDLFDIYAGDGHYHSAACHDQKIGDTKYATQHFYVLNLRTQAMGHTCLALFGKSRKKEHDLHALKRMNISSLRRSAGVGKKVLYVWDKASMDFRQWEKWRQKGIYFLSLEKELNRLLVIGEPQYDIDDPINKGVIANQMVSSANGDSIRRVLYKCPLSGKEFRFLTNMNYKIRPGVVASLYKHRWDIEKVFDDFKNKLLERKSWATSETAKKMQAQFMCMAYNLSILLEDEMEENENVEYKRDVERRKKRLDGELKKNKLQKQDISPLISEIHRVTQRPAVFFRWIRGMLYENTSWNQAVEVLRYAYANF